MDLVDFLEAWPPGRQTATVKEVIMLARKLHLAAYVVRPERYSVRRLLELIELRLNGRGWAGGGGTWGITEMNTELNTDLDSHRSLLRAWRGKGDISMKGGGKQGES